MCSQDNSVAKSTRPSAHHRMVSRWALWFNDAAGMAYWLVGVPTNPFEIPPAVLP